MKMRIGICRRFLLLALLPLLFTGCAASQTEPEGSESQTAEHLPGEDWKVQYIEMTAGDDGKIIGLAKTENGLFTIFNRTPESTEGYPVYYLSDKKLGQTNFKYTFESMSIEMPGEHQPFCLFSNEEKMYILASCDTGEEYSCFLYEVDAEEGDAQHVDITETWKAAFGEERGLALAAVDENGSVYIGMKGTECKILVASEDGSLISILRQQDFVLYDLTSVEGQIYCAGRSQGTDVLFHVDNQKQGLDMVAALPDSRGTMMLCPGQGNTVLYGYYDAIYQVDLDKGEGKDLYAWTNAGVDGRIVKEFFTDEQGNVWVLPDLEAEIFVMMLLQNPLAKSDDGAVVENEAAAEKETVIICGNEIRDTELAKAVGRFNITNDKYHVEIREYDYDRLAAEIMAGRGPDLVPLDSIGVSVGANKGIVEDLNPYLEASEILSRDMLNERVMDLYTVDGKLTCIPPSFCVTTLFGKESELGSEPGWTMEQFLDYVDEHRGLTVMDGVMRGDSRMIMVMMMWYARQQQWVDWEQGRAKFDEGEFEELLRFAAAYEAKYDSDPGHAEKKWEDGKLLLYSRPVLDMQSFLQYREVLAGDMVAIGYPTQEGTPCNMLSGYGMYGISAASTHKEGAWAFIEYLASSQTGENTYQYGIATLNSAMEDMLERAREEESNRAGYAIPAATDEDIMQFRQLLDNAVIRDGELIIVNEILTEEMDICFSGGRSVEETVDVIQSRLQLYLDENR